MLQLGDRGELLWVEGRDGGKHPTMHAVANVSSAKCEKGWFNLSCYVDSLAYKDSPGHVIVTMQKGIICSFLGVLFVYVQTSPSLVNTRPPPPGSWL